MVKTIDFIIPVKMGHETLDGIREFANKFIDEVRSVGRKDYHFRLCFVVDPPEKYQEVYNMAGLLLPCASSESLYSIYILEGQGSYGSSMAFVFNEYVTAKPDVDAVVVGDLTDDFFTNNMIGYAITYSYKAAPCVFLGRCGGGDGPWYRRIGRQVIAQLYNWAVDDDLLDATLSFRIYPFRVFGKGRRMAVAMLVNALMGKSPFETQLILAAWLRDIKKARPEFFYGQTKSTLRPWHVLGVLKMLFEMWWTVRLFKTSWKGIIGGDDDN